MVKVLSECPSVLDNPKPQCMVEELADFSVVLGVYGWVDQQNFDYLKVRSESVRLVKEAFDQAGISMPYPNMVVWQQKPTEPSSSKPASVLEGLETDVDLAPDRHLDELIDSERESARPDLLESAGQIE